MQDFPRWDQDMPQEDVKRLKPEDKGLRTAASFRRKVEILEDYAKDGIPLGSEKGIPRDRAKLRRWEDRGRRLWPWADPQVDVPGGRYADLCKRFEEAVSTIEARLNGKGGHLRRELEAKDRVIASLERQNVELLDQIRRLRKQVGAPVVERR